MRVIRWLFQNEEWQLYCLILQLAVNPHPWFLAIAFCSTSVNSSAALCDNFISFSVNEEVLCLPVQNTSIGKWLLILYIWFSFLILQFSFSVIFFPFVPFTFWGGWVAGGRAGRPPKPQCLSCCVYIYYYYFLLVTPLGTVKNICLALL